MKCPFCSTQDTKVIDSRIFNEGEQIKRRRECIKCQERFTTYEMPELSLPRVIKRDNRREAFNENKLRSGILRSLQKRNVSTSIIDKAIHTIKHMLRTCGDKEVSSKTIGDLVMRELRKIDEIAYVRFASVYQSFKDIAEFEHEISKIKGD